MGGDRDIGRETFPAKRRGLILDVLRREGAASIPRLSAALAASPSTIRRDLELLTREGYLDRSHGGALLKSRFGTTFEPDQVIEAQVAHDTKARIGAAAAALVEDGQSVVLDSSSTVLAAAERLVAGNLALTAVTNDLRIASVLARSQRIRTVVVGGTLRAGSFTLVGEPGVALIGGLHVDLALIGIHAVSGQRLTETSIEVAAMKRRMIEAAHRAVLLVDASKFRDPTFCDVCPLSEIDLVVTDAGVPPRECQAMRELGVDMLIADGAAGP